MASSRYLISSQTLGTTSTSVTFSSIPSIYTHLVLRWSTRTNNTATDTSAVMQLTVNSDTGGNYSRIALYSNGATISSYNSGSGSGYTYQNAGNVASNATATTFSNGELWIPFYNSSVKKQMTGFSVTENNATNAGIGLIASLWQGTSAVTSLSWTSLAGDFVTGYVVISYTDRCWD